MRPSIVKFCWAVVVVAGILLSGAWAVNCGLGLRSVSAAQSPPQNSQSPSLPDPPPPFGNGPPSGAKNPEHEYIEQVQNEQRQNQLAQDTDKLLALAKELKEEVDKSNGSTLPVDAIKKAAQIEKLAKSVKSRLRY